MKFHTTLQRHHLVEASLDRFEGVAGTGGDGLAGFLHGRDFPTSRLERAEVLLIRWSEAAERNFKAFTVRSLQDHTAVLHPDEFGFHRFRNSSESPRPS